MPARFDLLVFDWDGTLMDSASAIVESLQAACADLRLPVPSDGDARYIIGLGLADALGRLVPELDERDYPRLVESYRSHFLRRDAETGLFPGIRAMIESLHARGHRLAIATGKSRRGLDRALATSGLGPFFHASRCADEGRSKPDPEMLEHLIGVLGATPGRTLMIGDTTHDLEMARAAGVPRVGVAYGAHEMAMLEGCGPLDCFTDVRSLDDWLAANA